MIIVHGLGEHAACYSDLVDKVLAPRGIAVCGTDFPGHGESTGVRGDFISFDAVRLVIDESARELQRRLDPGTPIGILGHSLGGFHCLLYLQQRILEQTRGVTGSDSPLSSYDGDFPFVWISSPVIDPGHGQAEWLKALAGIIGFLAPTMRIDAGVRRSQCTSQEQKSAKENGGDREAEAELRRTQYPARHSTISARYGSELLRLGKILDPLLLDHCCPNLLMTHGSSDAITSPRLSKSFFDRLNLARKSYLLFEGYLHEPFNDVGRDTVYAAIASWLDNSLVPGLAL